MDFDSVARELLALPVDEFTASRNSKVKELKAASDDALAAQVGALRRPSLPLWAVNQLIPMDPKIKMILNIVVVIAVCLWLLQAFGVLGSLEQIRIR